MKIPVPWVVYSPEVLEHPQAHALVWPSLRKPHLDRNLHYNKRELCKCITTVVGESMQSITLGLSVEWGTLKQNFTLHHLLHLIYLEQGKITCHFAEAREFSVRWSLTFKCLRLGCPHACTPCFNAFIEGEALLSVPSALDLALPFVHRWKVLTAVPPLHEPHWNNGGV